MSDILRESSEAPDALPLNERSSAFVDSAAFLNFVRLKSQVALTSGSAEKSALTRTRCDEPFQALRADHDRAVVTHPANAAKEVDIQDEDWDSLFGAIEERLRDTVESLDSAATQLAPQARLSRIKSVVLDCVSSLDALHKALRQGRGPLVTSCAERDSADAWSAPRPTNANASSRKN